MGKETKSVTVHEREQRQPQTATETTRGTQFGANLPSQAMARLQRGAGNQAIGSLLGSGQRLPDSLRGEMEQRFGADFSQVRIHDHAQAHAAASGLKAKAFTFGNDIVFARYRYAPDTAQGRKLMAHELAHVIQQSRGGGELASDAAGPHESEAAAAADAFVGGGPVIVRGAAGLGIARAPEDDANIDLHRPLDIGEVREYRDSGGTAGKASRPTADVFVIEADLRAGQSTTRADYQTRALPTPEGLPNPKGGVTPVIPLGQGGFEKLHAIGPLLGHESPHGILYGPFTLNRQLMEHGIETSLSQLRDQLPPGGVLRLTVKVQRELGSGRYQGHEFLKSSSYSVDLILPGAKPRPVFRQEILVHRPQDPNTTYDIGEARLLIDDPLKKVTSSSPQEKRRRRVPDILPEMDKKARTKLFTKLTGVLQQLDARRKQAPQGSAQAFLVTVYADELRKALQAIKSPDRMTQYELENLPQRHEDFLRALKQLPSGGAAQATSPKTPEAKAAKNFASPKVPDTGALRKPKGLTPKMGPNLFEAAAAREKQEFLDEQRRLSEKPLPPTKKELEQFREAIQKGLVRPVDPEAAGETSSRIAIRVREGGGVATKPVPESGTPPAAVASKDSVAATGKPSTSLALPSRLRLNDGDNSLDPSTQPLPKKTEDALSKPPAAQPDPAGPEPSAKPKPAVKKPLGRKLPTAQPDPALERGGALPATKPVPSADKAPPRLPFGKKVGGTLGQMGWIAFGEGVGKGLENLNEWGIRRRTSEEVEKLKPQIKAYQEANPQEGVLIAVQVETWDPVWRPAETRPTRSFVSVIPKFGGKTREDAMQLWSATPMFLRGPSEGSTMHTDFLWIPPGKYVPLTKSNFINGRYLSDTDQRMLIFQFVEGPSAQPGALAPFSFSAVNARTEIPLRVQIVKPWVANLSDTSIRMTARVYDPTTSTTIESEFKVIDTELIQENWTTESGTGGINLWRKVPF